MKKRIQPLLYPSFFLLIFAVLFLWFSRIHPLIPFDADDWTYLAYVRSAAPVWGSWNPARVFPEVALPFFSKAASYLIMPLTGDFVAAQTLMHAFVVSAVTTVYLGSFACLLRRCFPISRLTASLLTTLFLIFHFLAMRRAESDNQYLLYCVNLTCYYYYLLPSLINASLVLCLMNNSAMDSFLKNGSLAKRGCFYVLIYFAIFSNLHASGILAAYAGCVLLLDILRRLKPHMWNRFFPENAFYLGVLLTWLVSAVFEFNGGRATNLQGGASLLVCLPVSFKCLVRAFLNLNNTFLLSVLSILLVSALVLILSHGKDQSARRFMPFAAASAIALAAYSVYLLVLCAAVNPYCLQRSEYLFGVFFFGMLLIMLALTYLICRFPKILMVLPILILFIASEIETPGRTFLESYFSDLSPSVCADINRDLIRQLQEADRQGEMEAVLRVPMFTVSPEEKDNWPHSLELMYRISDTLYAHGLVERPIYVRVVADPSMNTQYNIPIPQE